MASASLPAGARKTPFSTPRLAISEQTASVTSSASKTCPSGFSWPAPCSSKYRATEGALVAITIFALARSNFTRCFGSAVGSNSNFRKSPPLFFFVDGSIGGSRFETTLTIASALSPLILAVIIASIPTCRPSNSTFASPIPVKSSRASILTCAARTLTSGLFDSIVTREPASTLSGTFARNISDVDFPVWT